ncbi:probable WRKY transcription factor 46 [Miscanthus floridulus]|uniref:probable WRKY transcription factor 46 n=1 Tax=Miscanthus floridulus TaxID=154761 RepID=UPI0034585C5E
MDNKISSLVMPPPCGHGWEMMEAMRRQQDLLMQLRALVLPLLHGVIDDTSSYVHIIQLVVTSIYASTDSTYVSRRNNDKRSRSLVTHVPLYDGHLWRKYGQKNINGRKHPRSYYRCAYRERNCLATKTIEEQEPNVDESAKYTVVYYGDHTCKDHHTISMVQLSQLVGSMDLHSTEMPPTSTDFQESEADLDLPDLLEVFDSSLNDWEALYRSPNAATS